MKFNICHTNKLSEFCLGSIVLLISCIMQEIPKILFYNSIILVVFWKCYKYCYKNIELYNFINIKGSVM